jgi:hypothetical protein
MLTPSQIREIRELAAQGLSQRAIARKTRHCRPTIAGVLANSAIHRLHFMPQGLDALKYNSPARCPGCGRLIQLPCLACRIERLRIADRYARAA